MKKPYHFILLIFILIQLSFSNFLKAQYSIGWDSLGNGTKGNMPSVRALTINDTANLVYAGGDFTIAGGISAKHVAVWNDTIWDSLGAGTNKEVYALALYNGKLYAGGKFDSAGRKSSNHIASWDSTWDSLQNGVNGYVYALCVFNNQLYAGGDFTLANGIQAKRIAKWNGSAWDSVGAGFDSTVLAMTVFNDTLYAGGAFTNSKGKHVNYIAKWDGTNWDSLGSGMNNIVCALDTFSNPFWGSPTTKLYAGGAFTAAGGLAANHIASWNSNVWAPLASGTNDTVKAIGFSQSIIPERMESGYRQEELGTINVLIAGGTFTKAGNQQIPYISFWNGLSWDSTGTLDTLGIINKPVFAITTNSLFNGPSSRNYIGGEFDSALNFFAPLQSYQVNHVAQISVNVGGSINELSNKSEISIYPNPSNGVFTVETKNEKLTTKNVIEVYNMLGQEIYSSALSIQNSTFNIDISYQPSGIYLCRVLTENGDLIGSEKLIIQR